MYLVNGGAAEFSTTLVSASRRGQVVETYLLKPLRGGLLFFKAEPLRRRDVKPVHMAIVPVSHGPVDEELELCLAALLEQRHHERTIS